jgi:MoxR-like ATPase
MLFHGPPGVGKTMLAERVPGACFLILMCTMPWRSQRCTRSLASTSLMS